MISFFNSKRPSVSCENKNKVVLMNSKLVYLCVMQCTIYSAFV